MYRRLKTMSVYFGHPTAFWRDRQKTLTKHVINVEGMKKLGDVVDYDAVHLQKAIINRTSMKLQKLLENEDDLLQARKIKLKEMLENEEEYYIQKLVTKQEAEECTACKEWDGRYKKYEEDLKLERVRECQKALEREKIAKGMQCSKQDELLLREMQKIQMEEKRRIALEEEEKERMWHQMLINNVRRKEYNEQLEEERRRQEMLERRKLYDEQITSAARSKSDVLERERERENIRIESIRQKMEQDHFDALRKKKQQQQTNKKNYIEGHIDKIKRRENEKENEYKLDRHSIEIALEELRKERLEQKRMQRRLQVEKQVFVECSDREKKMAQDMEREAEMVTEELRKSEQNLCDEQLLQVEAEKKMKREKLAEDYRQYLEDSRMKSEKERLEREATMNRVRQQAIHELQLKLNNVNEEYRRQMEYRNSLTSQIKSNQRVMNEEKTLMENRLRPFTERMELFKQVMERKVDKSPGRLRFVRKLRLEEEESRKALNNVQAELKQKQKNEFFIHCDRRSLVNDVARRVDLCMQAYQQDLNNKREKLKELFLLEERQNIRQLVIDAQNGANLLWQEKKDRLKFLLDKRQKEHEAKYKDTPISKCAHVRTCLVQARAKEAQQHQLYQMKEKEARKLAEKEFDHMWHEVAMKESEALAARMEQQAIERLRRDIDCKQYTDYQLEEKQKQRQKEIEMMKEEGRRLRAMFEEDMRKEEETKRHKHEQRLKEAEDQKLELIHKKEHMDKVNAERRLVKNTWDSLAQQGAAAELADREFRRRKERELVASNKRIVELNREFEMYMNNNEALVHEEANRIREDIDRKRCAYKLWSIKTNKDCREAMIEQIKERERKKEELNKQIKEEEEYAKQLHNQIEELIQHQKKCEQDARNKHKQHLLDQIEYNKLLKERALQEEMKQRQLGLEAAQDYQIEINKMICRPFHTEKLHPFMKVMAQGIQPKVKCPCSKPDYCA